MNRRSAWVLAGLVLLAFNLRPAAVSVGPVLAEVSDGLGMSAASTGLLTSLPVLAFAVFGAGAPWLARRIGLHRAAFTALVAAAVGQGARVLVVDERMFLALSMLALAGMAAANVLLPSLVKLHFPRRIGMVTSIYTTALAIGLTCALTFTVPLAETFGGWRSGLGTWAALAAVAVVPWLSLIGHDRALPATELSVRLVDAARTPLGMAMAAFFGLQSLQAYAIFGWFAQLWRDAGFSPATAGLLVGVVGLVSIPLSLWLPAQLARSYRPRALLLAVIACYPVGYVGLMFAPHSLAALWALVVGTATATFPMILVMIGLRSRTPSGTAALSGFTQSAGYLVAAAGPFAVGLLNHETGGWTWPLAFLLALVVPMVALAAYVTGPHHLEDQLAARAPA